MSEQPEPTDDDGPTDEESRTGVPSREMDGSEWSLGSGNKDSMKYRSKYSDPTES